MLAYILDNEDLKIKDLVEFEDYSFSSDIECNAKSSIVTVDAPDVENDDLVFCKDGNETLFVGIASDITDNNSENHTITLAEKECFFDRQIFVGTESLISSTGLEDFIASEITANWINSGDVLLDKEWLTVSAMTHNTVNAKVSTIGSVENGVYNLKTFLGNCKERYGIICDFVFNAQTTGVCVQIRKDAAAVVPIDTGVSDVSAYTEEYSVDVLSKLNVKWKNTSTEVVTDTTFYLKTDSTVTTDPDDPDRAKGTIKSIYIEAETQAEMVESVVQEFSNNSYQHKITLSINKDSRAYTAADYYVGRSVSIKKRSGVQTTLVTGRTETSGSAFVGLVFGKLKVTLIEKLRGKMK